MTRAPHRAAGRDAARNAIRRVIRYALRHAARYVLWAAAGIVLLPPLSVRAAGPAQDPAALEAKWKQEEQQCISKCPKFPRFGGTENDRQYRQRMQAEDAYNRCYHRCTREYMRKLQMKIPRLNDGSEDYYKRNENVRP